MSLEQPFPIQRPFHLRWKEGSESEDKNAGMGEHSWTLSIQPKTTEMIWKSPEKAMGTVKFMK